MQQFHHTWAKKFDQGDKSEECFHLSSPTNFDNSLLRSQTTFEGFQTPGPYPLAKASDPRIDIRIRVPLSPFSLPTHSLLTVQACFPSFFPKDLSLACAPVNLSSLHFQSIHHPKCRPMAPLSSFPHPPPKVLPTTHTLALSTHHPPKKQSTSPAHPHVAETAHTLVSALPPQALSSSTYESKPLLCSRTSERLSRG
jgi:hypothetical protein